MKTRHIASFFGMAALAAAAGSSATERTLTSGEVDAGNEAALPIPILIMAVGRSGSSMVGEFFRQSEDVLYFYEPCRKPKGVGLVDMECLALLQRLTRCEFTLKDSAWIANDEDASSRGSPEVLSIMQASDAQQFAQAHEHLIDTCTRRRAVAVKSIRLYEGLGGDNYDVSGFKVLHLVRDPRGVVRSQSEHFKEPGRGARKVAVGTTKARAGGVSICGTYKSQLDSSKKLEESRYLLVRYEDIATSPELALELMYCWTGLGPVPPSVSEWVEMNTKMPTCDDGANRMRHLRSSTDEIFFGFTRTKPENLNLSAGTDGPEGSVRDEPNVGRVAGAARGRAGVVSRQNQKRARNSGGGRGGRGGGGNSNSNRNSNRARSLPDCRENTNEAIQNPFGTRRRSANMVSMWRTIMPEEEAQAVWDACQDSGVMDALGYDL